MLSRKPRLPRALPLLGGMLTLAVILAAPAAAQEELTPLDVLMLKSVSGAYPSPDGEQVVFTRSVPRGPEDGPGGGYAALYLLTDDGDVPLVDEKGSIGGVAWTPDGRHVTFVSRREGGYPQLFVIDMDDGEIERVFDAPGLGVSAYRVNPEGTAVAFTSVWPAPQGRGEARAAGFRQRIYDEDWNPIGLFIWAEDTEEIRQIEVPGSVYGLEWSPDGTSIAYLSAADARDPHAGMLFTADASTGEVTSLTPGFEGMVHSFQWLAADKMRLVISRGVESRVSDFAVGSRTFTDLPAADFAFGSVHTAGDLVVATGSGPLYPPELHVLDGSTWIRRTDSNPVLADVELSRQEPYSFMARDGVEIEGILMYPLNFQDGTRYPLVISVHGGPESHHNNVWLISYGNWGQLLSRKDFFVWSPNYRSSTGRGVAFAKDGHGDLAGTEFDGQVDAIGHFVGLGWVDRGRVGLGGASCGTTWRSGVRSPTPPRAVHRCFWPAAQPTRGCIPASRTCSIGP